MTVTGTSNTTGTLQVTGTNSGTATITGGGTIDADKVLINSDNTLTIAGKTVLDCSGSTTDLNIDGTVTITDSSQIKLASTTTDVAKLITSGSGGTISGNGQNQTKIITGDADLEGHTTVTDTTLYLDGNQSASISASTLELIDSTFEVGEKVYITGVNDDVNDSHIEALGTAAGNTSTINNHSTLDNNTLGLLDVIAGSTAGYTTSLDVDNTAATASIFNITTANVTGDATGGAATLNFKATGDTSNVVQDINLTTLNINGVDATGTATVTSQNHTDLSVNTINFTGTTGVFDNQVAYASTSATTAKLGAVNVGTESGDAATGTLKSTVSNAKTTITTATVTGGTSAGTLNISGDDANDTFAITTLNLAGADAVTDAVLTVNNNSSVNIATTALASGTFGTINNNSNTAFTDGTINGELKITGATLNLANGAFTIGSTGKLDVSANNMTVDNSDKLIFDLGTTSDATDNVVDTAKTYATATGNITATRTGTTIENVYGKEGVSGETYLDVVSFAVGVGATADDVLQTDDYLRTYTLKDQDGEGDAFDILVTTNTSGISSTINTSGGSAQDAADIEELVNKQATADAAGGEYITQVLNMSARDQITAMEEKRGQDATTSSTQASIQTISSASGAVKNQMTSFRSGSLSAGMTSSFSSSGATAALNDMADAQTLEDAYSSVGYTADTAEDDYRKHQVWANGFGGFGEQGSTDNSRGYDFHNIGTMIGIDYRLSQELRLGGLLGYSYNVTEIYKNSGDSKDNAIRTGAYASYSWNNFFIDLSPTCGIHILESTRNLNTGMTATGERTGFDFNINTTIGYTFNFQNNLMLTPSFSLGYTMFYDPEYTETGAGVQNNKFDSFTSNSLLQDIGIKAGKLFRHSDTLSFLPEVWGGWEVEYLNTGGDRNSTTSASLFSNTYTSSMDGMATHRGYWGAGLTALIRDNISVYGRYDHKIWEKGFNVGFSAGIKVSF